jgi:hypothetical protein
MPEDKVVAMKEDVVMARALNVAQLRWERNTQ